MKKEQQNRLQPAAQLWIGSHDYLQNEVIHYLQRHLCSEGGCTMCITCQHIAKQQQHNVTWIAPDRQYTLEHLAPIFTTIALAPVENQPTFFIITHADFLSAACANKLLKPLEEPPVGYHFILLAERTASILPTIYSRCMVYTYTKNSPEAEHQFFTIFSTHDPYDPAAFLKLLNKCAPNERESITIVNELLRYWVAKSTHYLKNNDQHNYKASSTIVDILKTALCKPPMPGSSKVFWKDLFLQIKTPR